MKNVKIKIFEKPNADLLEMHVNGFMEMELVDCDILDIKLHVDEQQKKDTDCVPMYIAMIIYQ
jgi:hypothetical protein